MCYWKDFIEIEYFCLESLCSTGSICSVSHSRGIWLIAVDPGAGQEWTHNKTLNPQDIFVEYIDKTPNKKMNTGKQDMTLNMKQSE